MGFLSSILKFAAPIVGGAVAGPLGAAVGGSLGTAITGNLSSGLSGAASAYGEYSDQRAATSAANAQYGQTFAAQQALGEQANAQRIAAAQKQMDFQERMSSTSHQREIKDLAAAGLNPILSSKYGGSSTPGGAMAQIADTHTPAAASAQARAQQTMQLTQMASQVNLQRAQANKVTAETANVKKVGEQIQATTVNLGQTQKKIVADVASLKQMTTNNAVREKILEIEKRIKFLNPKNLLSVGGEKIIAELAPLLNEGGPDWKATIMRVISQFLGTTTEPDPRKKSAPISSKGRTNEDWHEYYTSPLTEPN